MAEQRPKLLRVLICQVVLDIGLDRICADRRLIPFEIEAAANPSGP
jgi:hypothetical protein